MLDGDRAVCGQHLGQAGMFLGEEAHLGFVHRVQADDLAARNQRHAQPTADILRVGGSFPTRVLIVSAISRVWRDCNTWRNAPADATSKVRPVRSAPGPAFEAALSRGSPGGSRPPAASHSAVVGHKLAQGVQQGLQAASRSRVRVSAAPASRRVSAKTRCFRSAC